MILVTVYCNILKINRFALQVELRFVLIFLLN